MINLEVTIGNWMITNFKTFEKVLDFEIKEYLIYKKLLDPSITKTCKIRLQLTHVPLLFVIFT